MLANPHLTLSDDAMYHLAINKPYLVGFHPTHLSMSSERYPFLKTTILSIIPLIIQTICQRKDIESQRNQG